MRAGVREFRDASLKIVVPMGLPEHMRDRMREITHLYVKPESRGQKLATALMNFICQEADANLITLVLTARNFEDGGPDEAQLITWYERFGFTKLQDTPTGAYMARQVRTRERPLIKPVTLAVAEALSQALH